MSRHWISDLEWSTSTPRTNKTTIQFAEKTGVQSALMRNAPDFSGTVHSFPLPEKVAFSQNLGFQPKLDLLNGVMGGLSKAGAASGTKLGRVGGLLAGNAGMLSEGLLGTSLVTPANYYMFWTGSSLVDMTLRINLLIESEVDNNRVVRFLKDFGKCVSPEGVINSEGRVSDAVQVGLNIGDLYKVPLAVVRVVIGESKIPTDVWTIKGYTLEYQGPWVENGVPINFSLGLQLSSLKLPERSTWEAM